MKFFKKLETALVMPEVENADFNLESIEIFVLCWLLHKGVQHILDYRFKCKQLESGERVKMKKMEIAAKPQRRKPKKKRM